MFTAFDNQQACSINRNIVECKASNFKDSINESVVLIETSWNVKVPTGVEIIGYLYVLIETSWNVKYAAAAELPDIGVMY